MKSLNSRWLRVMTLTCAAMMLAATPVAAATAKSTTAGGPGTIQLETTQYWRETNPWRCDSQAQDPHLSGHYPGTAAAVGIHRCLGYYGSNSSIRTFPIYQTLETWLYYESCFFFICGYNQADHWSSGEVGSAVTITVSHTAAANCNNGNNTKWRLLVHGSSYGFNGSQNATYTSSVENVKTFACGR